jgi:putative flippase GtrA
VTRFTRFLVVGGVGFIADAALLALLTAGLAVDPFLARIVSIGFALTVTWVLNRAMTFGPSGRHVAVEGARYGGVGIATSIVNLAVYAALLAAVPACPPLLALAVGSAVAMALSFVGYSRLVFDR